MTAPKIFNLTFTHLTLIIPQVHRRPFQDPWTIRSSEILEFGYGKIM